MKTKNFPSIANDELLEWNVNEQPQNPTPSRYFIVRYEDMIPAFNLADVLLLNRCKGQIIQGREYVINTTTYGTLFRFLRFEGQTLVAYSTNEKIYPAIHISPDEVIDIYSVDALFRQLY